MPNVPNLPGIPPLGGYSPQPGVPLLSTDAVVQSVFQTLQWGIFYQGVPVILPASIASSVLGGIANNVLAPISSVAAILGIPNLLPVFASTAEFDYDQEWSIADYPQEGGAFQSYDRVQHPFDVRSRLVCSGPTFARQAFINSIFAIAGASPLGASSLVTAAVSAASAAFGVGTGIAGLSSAASSLTGSILAGALAPPTFDLVTPEGTYSSCSVRRLSFGRRADQGASMIIADLYWLQVRATSTAQFNTTAVPGIAGQQGVGTVQPQTPTIATPTTIY